MRTSLLLPFLLAACGGGDDGQQGPRECTGAIYDPCDTEHDCRTDRCQNFAAEGLLVCSQACTPNEPATCPPLDGAPAICTADGVCKPPAANDCVRP